MTLQWPSVPTNPLSEPSCADGYFLANGTRVLAKPVAGSMTRVTVLSGPYVGLQGLVPTSALGLRDEEGSSPPTPEGTTSEP
jgi:hypothetical protein